MLPILETFQQIKTFIFLPSLFRGPTASTFKDHHRSKNKCERRRRIRRKKEDKKDKKKLTEKGKIMYEQRQEERKITKKQIEKESKP